MPHRRHTALAVPPAERPTTVADLEALAASMPTRRFERDDIVRQRYVQGVLQFHPRTDRERINAVAAMEVLEASLHRYGWDDAGLTMVIADVPILHSPAAVAAGLVAAVH